MTEEKLARFICSRLDRLLDPDMIAHAGEPLRTSFGYVQLAGGSPLWMWYLPLAKEIIEQFAAEDGDVK